MYASLSRGSILIGIGNCGTHRNWRSTELEWWAHGQLSNWLSIGFLRGFLFQYPKLNVIQKNKDSSFCKQVTAAGVFFDAQARQLLVNICTSKCRYLILNNFSCRHLTLLFYCIITPLSDGNPTKVYGLSLVFHWVLFKRHKRSLTDASLKPPYNRSWYAVRIPWPIVL